MVTGPQAAGEPGSDLAGVPEGTPLTGYDLARLLALGSNVKGTLLFKGNSGCPRKKISLLVRLSWYISSSPWIFAEFVVSPEEFSLQCPLHKIKPLQLKLKGLITGKAGRGNFLRKMVGPGLARGVRGREVGSLLHR